MQDQNPYAAPQTIDDNSFKTSSPGLPNLAQQSRLASLKGARGALIVVGVIALLLFSAAMFSGSRALSDWQGTILPIGAASGALLIVLGLLIYRMPIIATMIGLVIYTAMMIVSFATFPGNGNIGYIKIMIFIVLFNAVRAAFAYEKEQKISGSRTF